MVEGKIPYKNRYIVSEVNQIGGGEPVVKIVSPVQSSVDQAKSSIKRKLDSILPLPIKRKKTVKVFQLGKGSKKKNTKKSIKKKKQRKCVKKVKTKKVKKTK